MVIKQVLDLTDNAIKLYGLTIGMCSIVAIVRTIDHSSTKITYRLEDLTGQIDAHLWLEDGADNFGGPPVVVNTYCRIYGSVRSQNNGKTIMLFKLEPVSSVNEVTTHLLEVLHARYMSEKFTSDSMSEYGGAEAGNAALANGFGGLAVNGAGSGAGTSTTAVNSATGLKGKDLAVFEAVKKNGTDKGISMDELLRKFSHISESEMRYIYHLLLSV